MELQLTHSHTWITKTAPKPRQSLVLIRRLHRYLDIRLTYLQWFSVLYEASTAHCLTILTAAIIAVSMLKVIIAKWLGCMNVHCLPKSHRLWNNTDVLWSMLALAPHLHFRFHL